MMEHAVSEDQDQKKKKKAYVKKITTALVRYSTPMEWLSLSVQM